MTASPRATSDGVVSVNNHLVSIVRPSVDLDQSFSIDNHLIHVHESGIYLMVGKWGGPVRLRIEAWDAAPPLTPAGWETIVERSFAGTPEKLFTESGPNDVVDLPALAHLQVDTMFRLRAHVTGRDSSYDQIDVTESESLLLQFWQQPASASITLAVGDEMARFSVDPPQ